MNYRISVVKYGYITIEANSANEAIEIANGEHDSSFDWSDFCEAEVVEEFEED